MWCIAAARIVVLCFVISFVGKLVIRDSVNINICIRKVGTQFCLGIHFNWKLT